MEMLTILFFANLFAPYVLALAGEGRSDGWRNLHHSYVVGLLVAVAVGIGAFFLPLFVPPLQRGSRDLMNVAVGASFAVGALAAAVFFLRRLSNEDAPGPILSAVFMAAATATFTTACAYAWPAGVHKYGIFWFAGWMIFGDVVGFLIGANWKRRRRPQKFAKKIR